MVIGIVILFISFIFYAIVGYLLWHIDEFTPKNFFDE